MYSVDHVRNYFVELQYNHFKLYIKGVVMESLTLQVLRDTTDLYMRAVVTGQRMDVN